MIRQCTRILIPNQLTPTLFSLIKIKDMGYSWRLTNALFKTVYKQGMERFL